ncbi:hypothetical protein O1L44_30665 [Streptomyces noursei]|uniref:hypothetical protein n=1 Tax=Streptomyces noursei TaxID=1971 RepID=UPI00081C3A7F|nr:hypothetical protein SNOUR_00570 [Streptomyces noursei ATCC 11455]ANZ21898.1 hypothetical protein SNOUR_43380 [Streptomyces noursei ATCC 11455]MCZ0996497.1 hypothetical protein [Streptomyces noursei]
MSMDGPTYTAKLKELRELRKQIAAKEKEEAAAQKRVDAAAVARDELARQRNRIVCDIEGYGKANGETVAKAAGIRPAELAQIAPRLDTTPTDVREARDGVEAPQPTAVREVAEQPTVSESTSALSKAPSAQAPAAEPSDASAELSSHASHEAIDVAERNAPDPTTVVSAPAQPSKQEAAARVLPSIPEGPEGARFLELAPGLKSTRRRFKQKTREMVFLNTNTGDLVARVNRADKHVRLDLGDRSPGAILDAVLSVAPDTQRIYVTAGNPWHRDEHRYNTLTDAVLAWLSIPSPRWSTDTGQGRDRLAGHFLRARTPVGRFMRADSNDHVEIRSLREWLDQEEDDPALGRDALRALWRALSEHWPDEVVLMGSPGQTGRDLWTRTVPTTGQWAGGYPVMSPELRGLIHATAGQGRVELFAPPGLTQAPELVEYDRTFAYARHTWKSPVGEPRRMTGAAFGALSDSDKKKALFACSHWHVRATVPRGWDHIGLLPAPAPGDRDWHYPAGAGAVFETWASGPEVYGAVTNHLQPWKIEILDGLVWQEGKPLDDWSKKLQAAWAGLKSRADLHGDPRERAVAYLASRAVRAILLQGIGSFASRPGMVTGTARVGEHLPDGVEIIGEHRGVITWQRRTEATDERNSHPEWPMYVWGGARYALLDTNMKGDKVHVGALYVPRDALVAARTDALTLTMDPRWPYHGKPGEYRKKGHLIGPVPWPTTEAELLKLQGEGRAALRTAQAGGAT